MPLLAIFLVHSRRVSVMRDATSDAVVGSVDGITLVGGCELASREGLAKRTMGREVVASCRAGSCDGVLTSGTTALTGAVFN